jgi:hypothetical protein
VDWLRVERGALRSLTLDCEVPREDRVGARKRDLAGLSRQLLQSLREEHGLVAAGAGDGRGATGRRTRAVPSNCREANRAPLLECLN